MSTSTKTPASIRHGGPGASHENAKEPIAVLEKKGHPDNPHRSRSNVSGGGGERDSHHTHDPERKGDRGGANRRDRNPQD